MANRSEKWEDNVSGAFYVDKDCILCTLCGDLSPDCFKESDEEFIQEYTKQCALDVAG